MRFTINWRFLLKLIAAVVVVAVPVHLLHRYQVRKQVDVFLRHADEARDKKEPEREINFLRRYLMARPDDIDTRERLARALCKNARSVRQLTEGYLAVEDVLRREPERQELRRFVIDFALDPRLGLYAEARVHIEYLLDPKRRPNDGELEGLYAKSLALQGRFGESSADAKGAWHWYERSIGHRKDLIDSYIGLAGILRFQLRKADEADRLVAAMLGVDRNDPKKQDAEAARNLQNFRTFVYLAEYWRSLNRENDVAAAVAPAVAAAQMPPKPLVRDAFAHAVEKARSLAPDELEVLLLAAEVARDRARDLAAEQKEAEQARAKARQFLARAMELHPKSSAVYLAAAALDAETKSLDEALATVRKGCKILPDSRELMLALLDYQIRSADTRGASETLDRLANTGLPPVLVDYHHARILALEDRWLDASLVLAGIREEAASDPELSRQVHLLLAQSSVQLGEYDNALAAFQRARPDNTSDPLWIPALLGIAEMQAALGQDEEALAIYRELKDYAGGAWVPILRLEMLRVLREPDEKKRDWTAAVAARDAADSYFPDPHKAPTNFRIFKAELESFRGNHEAARQSLKDLQEERPQELPVRLAVAVEEARSGNPQAAAATLADAEKDLGDSEPLRLARARLWVESKPSDLAAKLESLVAGAEKFPRAEQRRLLRGLADLAQDSGSAELASKILEKLAVLQPDDLSVKLVLFDRALQADRFEDAAAIQREIQRIDGETGTSARFSKAVLALWRAQKRNDQSGLGEARILLEAVELRRPHWGRVALALALLHDLRGDADTAIDKFREALGKGETSPAALRRYMELLTSKFRFEEAREVLHKLDESSAALSRDARRLAAEIERRTGNLADAIGHAIRAVPPDSTNPRDQIWLGQLFWAARDDKRAEAALRKATDLDPAGIDGWLVLIQFLNATNRPEDARKALEIAKDKVEMAERSLFLALGYVLLGDYNNAAPAFQKASAERPAHVPTLQAKAQFLFLTGDLRAAREAFDRVVHLKSATPEEREAALTMLAFAFAADQDYEVSRRALETLELLRPKTSAETPAQKRNRILILARRNDRESRLQAIRLLEEDRGSLTMADQFLLARLHLEVGSKHRPQVRVVMADLLRRPGAAKVPLYLSFYAKFLLDEGDPTEAVKWIDRLKEVRGDVLETALLEARLLAARKELPKARSLLLKWAEMEKASLDAIAQACEDIGLFEDAEKLFQRYAAEAQASYPRAPLKLAMFYGRRNRVVEALPVCELTSVSVPVSEVADIVVAVLYLARSRSPEDIARAYQWLEAMAAKSPRQPLFRQRGDIRNLQGDYAAAISLYRQAIAHDAKDVQSLNNLAFLISARENKHDEALKLIDQAGRAVGPDDPNLLDTEAIVRLNKGEFDAARQRLERILAVTPNAVAYFHLAQAELAAKRDLERRVAWKHATDLGLKRDDLHPLEWPGFDLLAKELK